MYNEKWRTRPAFDKILCLPNNPHTSSISGYHTHNDAQILHLLSTGMRKVWSALADILDELEKHPLLKAGSLCFQSSSIDVSAVASDRFVVLTPEGPFDASISSYAAFAEQYLTLIADGQLYTEYPVGAYLVYRFLKDTEVQVPEKCFLKHVDDRGDHLLVDENLNITGIIDWQMARVVPRREAFGPSLVTADMSALCGGKVSIGADDVTLAGALRGKGVP